MNQITLPYPPSVNGNRQMPSDATIAECYSRLGNVWKVGKELGIAGQTVHKKLKKMGVERKNPCMTETEVMQIREIYAKGFTKGDGELDALAARLGRTKQLICRFAKSEKLTSVRRPLSQTLRLANAKKAVDRWKREPHPRGALGMKHTDATKLKLSWASRGHWDSMTQDKRDEQAARMLKTRFEKYGTLAPSSQSEKRSWKAGWREVGGTRKYFRSRWEVNYAVYLQFLKEQGQISGWKHEPKTFWFEGIKRGCVSYLPDFEITNLDGSTEFHEVKGWMDSRSRTKLARMKKYHPLVKLRVIDGKWFNANGPKLAFLKGWEK